jgi:hypothetical protein
MNVFRLDLTKVNTVDILCNDVGNDDQYHIKAKSDIATRKCKKQPAGVRNSQKVSEYTTFSGKNHWF